MLYPEMWRYTKHMKNLGLARDPTPAEVYESDDFRSPLKSLDAFGLPLANGAGTYSEYVVRN